MVAAVFLHPHRADVLAALALAVDGREPLPEAIERLGQDDPLLSRWARRLAGPLRDGRPLGELLRHHRLVTAAEAARVIDAGSLARLASAARRPRRGYGLVRWLPVCFATVLVVPATVMGQGIALLGDRFSDRLVRDLGIVTGPTDRMVHGSLIEGLAGVAMVVGGVALGQWILSLIPFVRHVLHLWCPEVHRAHLVVRLIRQARAGTTSHQRWRRDWSAWLMLSRFRLRKAERILLKQLPGLEQRLHALGLLPERDGRTDWDAAEAESEERLATAIDPARPLLYALLMLIGALATMRLFAGPMLRFIENVSMSAF